MWNLGEQNIVKIQGILFARGATHTSQLFEKGGGKWVDVTVVKNGILFSASCVYCRGLEVQQHSLLIRAREKSAIKISKAQGISDGTTVLTRGLIV